MDMSIMESFVGASQLKRVTFVKMGIADNFQKYAQKHIEKKVKKEPNEEPQSVVGQTMGTQDQTIDLQSEYASQQTQRVKAKGQGFK